MLHYEKLDFLKVKIVITYSTLKQIIKWVKYLNMNKSIFVKFFIATL